MPNFSRKEKDLNLSAREESITMNDSSSSGTDERMLEDVNEMTDDTTTPGAGDGSWSDGQLNSSSATHKSDRRTASSIAVGASHREPVIVPRRRLASSHSTPVRRPTTSRPISSSGGNALLDVQVAKGFRPPCSRPPEPQTKERVLGGSFEDPVAIPVSPTLRQRGLRSNEDSKKRLFGTNEDLLFSDLVQEVHVNRNGRPQRRLVTSVRSQETNWWSGNQEATGDHANDARDINGPLGGHGRRHFSTNNRVSPRLSAAKPRVIRNPISGEGISDSLLSRPGSANWNCLNHRNPINGQGLEILLNNVSNKLFNMSKPSNIKSPESVLSRPSTAPCKNPIVGDGMGEEIYKTVPSIMPTEPRRNPITGDMC